VVFGIHLWQGEEYLPGLSRANWFGKEEERNLLLAVISARGGWRVPAYWPN
jgi:hypothetical protein